MPYKTLTITVCTHLKYNLLTFTKETHKSTNFSSLSIIPAITPEVRMWHYMTNCENNERHWTEVKTLHWMEGKKKNLEGLKVYFPETSSQKLLLNMINCSTILFIIHKQGYYSTTQKVQSWHYELIFSYIIEIVHNEFVIFITF